jgi:hypothetical protein
MSENEIDDATAERLLDGPAPDFGAQPGDDRHAGVAALLAAAAGPARADELSGEHAALAAFREARLEPETMRPRRLQTMKSSMARFLTLKAGVAGAVAITAVGGVAFAATGAFSGTPSKAASDHVSSTGHQSSHLNVPGTAQVAANVNTLCARVTGTVAAAQRQVLTDPAFAPLRQAVSTADKVAPGALSMPQVQTYCADLSRAGTTAAKAPSTAPSALCQSVVGQSVNVANQVLSDPRFAALRQAVITVNKVAPSALTVDMVYEYCGALPPKPVTPAAVTPKQVAQDAAQLCGTVTSTSVDGLGQLLAEPKFTTLRQVVMTADKLTPSQLSVAKVLAFCHKLGSTGSGILPTLPSLPALPVPTGLPVPLPTSLTGDLP